MHARGAVTTTKGLARAHVHGQYSRTGRQLDRLWLATPQQDRDGGTSLYFQNEKYNARVGKNELTLHYAGNKKVPETYDMTPLFNVPCDLPDFTVHRASTIQKLDHGILKSTILVIYKHEIFPNVMQFDLKFHEDPDTNVEFKLCDEEVYMVAPSPHPA